MLRSDSFKANNIKVSYSVNTNNSLRPCILLWLTVMGSNMAMYGCFVARLAAETPKNLVGSLSGLSKETKIKYVVF